MRSTSVLVKRYWISLSLIIALCAATTPVLAFSQKDEIDLGKKLDVEIMKQYRLSDDEQTQKDIEEYGQKLVKGVRRPEIKYHFKVLKDDVLNAFSTPGGYVYFSEHLWNVLRKDEQIGVLAHEITHIDRRHAIDAMLKQQRRQIWLTVLLSAAGANSTWGDIAGLAESLYTLKYSRGDEQQADEVAVELCQKAGYAPDGILLAIRKIKRFEDERGGAPPKILSDHPPTKDRVVYLERELQSQHLPVPPENIGQVQNPNKVGEVTQVDTTGVTFTSSKPLNTGDVVWLMGGGWDYHYENRTEVPIARVVVKSTGGKLTGDVWPMPTAKKNEIAKGAGVYSIPMPNESLKSIGELLRVGNTSRLQTSVQLKPMDRLIARQVVWNKDFTKLIYDNVGYVVITDPSSKNGYIALTRAKFSYAPVEANSVLIKCNDPKQGRWVGPVVSIGRSGQTLEVKPVAQLDPNKLYDIAYPAWNSDDDYAKRVVGKAKLQSEPGKTVVKITSFTDGWSMADIQNGFDVYEQPEAGVNNNGNSK